MYHNLCTYHISHAILLMLPRLASVCVFPSAAIAFDSKCVLHMNQPDYIIRLRIFEMAGQNTYMMHTTELAAVAQNVLPAFAFYIGTVIGVGIFLFSQHCGGNVTF